MSYNETALQATEDMWGLLTYANDSAGGILFTLLVVSIFFIMVMALRRYGFENSIMVSGFFCLIFSGVLASIGVIDVWVALIFGFLTAGMYFYTTTIQN